MRTSKRFASAAGLAALVAATLLPPSAPARAATESVIYSFSGGADGGNPLAPLIAVGTTLYGTTVEGGTTTPDGSTGGTVFSITLDGVENVLYAFKGGNRDGRYPQAGLLNVDGTLYGTTASGGADHVGTVFAVTTSGAETRLFDFTDALGLYPSGPLIKAGLSLYGTTRGRDGGSSPTACGSVYKVTRLNHGRLVHGFPQPHGETSTTAPTGSLLDLGGALYGTSGDLSGRPGTVFKMTKAGVVTVLYVFKGNPNVGMIPSGGLANLDGTLYGVATNGADDRCGEVFSITPAGAETVLHLFGSGDDGCEPSELTRVGNKLYGTTRFGGTANDGTVFSITPDGTEKVLYSFQGGSDGVEPNGGLLSMDGKLYGTTTTGGSAGYGTVFVVTP